MTTRLEQLVIKRATAICRARGLVEAPTLVSAVLQKLAAPGSSWRGTDLSAFASSNDLTLRAAAEIAEEVRRTMPSTETDSVSVDIVAVTALGLEAAAVESYLTDVREQIHPSTGTIYRVGQLGTDKGAMSVAVVVASEGNPVAASETERAIAHFKPAVAVFVGVAGGLKNDVQKGDVVAASYVYDYSAAKEGGDLVSSRVKTLPASYAAHQRALALATNGAWLKLAASQPGAVIDKGGARAYVKPIAAGPKLVGTSDGPTAQWIKEHCGDALAVEMEGFGFHTAALAHPTTQAVVVRGISDCVDDKTPSEDRRWQPIAASRAAAFALTLASALIAGATSKER